MKVLEYIEHSMEQALEYVEHKDYGEGYVDCLEPSEFIPRLPKILEGVDFKGVSLKDLSENITLHTKVEVSYTLKPTPPYCLDRWLVGEIEEQFSFEEVREATGKRLTMERAKALGLTIGDQGYFYQYATTDVVWCAVIDIEALLEFIEEESAQD